jgi:cytochrome c oxidase assembly protein subunit 11
MNATRTRRSNARTALLLSSIVVGMTGVSFAAVPLYRWFCQVTGFGGTPMINAAAAPGAAEGGPRFTVRFVASTGPDLPWGFRPDAPIMQVAAGEEALAFYRAVNRGSVPVTGVATYNVTPEKVGRYFHKTACFCFQNQTLAPDQDMPFPLSFWIDPAITTDPSTRDVRAITVSYTFHRSLEDAARSGALATAGPHVGPRAP